MQNQSNKLIGTTINR